MASKTTRPSAAALRGCIRFSLLGFSALTLSLVVVSGALALLLIRSSQVRTMAFQPLESSGSASVSSLLADVTGRQPGPWGEMVFTDADMEVPVEFAAFDDNINTNRITAWRFEQMQPADVRSLMQDCGLTAAQVETACAPEIIAADTSGTTVRPDDALILSLSPGPREKLYTCLAASSANLYMAYPFIYPRHAFDRIMRDSGLNERLVKAARQLIYERGDTQLLSDHFTLLRLCGSAKERFALVGALTRRPVVHARLYVRPDSDLDSIIAYWSVGDGQRQVRPLLESVRNNPNGGTVSLAYLLPEFARQRLFTFPTPARNDPKMDCQWTAFNFFNDATDNGIADMKYLSGLINTKYHMVPKAEKLGDIVALWNAKGDWYHSCVYIAGDIVFTKNGDNSNMPWNFMHLDDVKAIYAYGGHEPEVKVFRENGL